MVSFAIFEVWTSKYDLFCYFFQFWILVAVLTCSSQWYNVNSLLSQVLSFSLCQWRLELVLLCWWILCTSFFNCVSWSSVLYGFLGLNWISGCLWLQHLFIPQSHPDSHWLSPLDAVWLAILHHIFQRWDLQLNPGNTPSCNCPFHYHLLTL